MLTQKEIEAYRKKLGITIGKNKNRGRRKILSDAQIRDAFTMYLYSVPVYQICEYFGIHQTTFYKYLRTHSSIRDHRIRHRYNYDIKKHSEVRRRQAT